VNVKKTEKNAMEEVILVELKTVLSSLKIHIVAFSKKAKANRLLIEALSMEKKQKQALLMGEGTVEDLEKGRRMFEMLAQVFTRPIIAMVGWEDSITAEQKARIEIERMKQVREADGKPIIEATDYEAMVYIMTASLTQPLSSTYFNIYAYLFRKFYPDKAKEIFEEHEGQKLDQWIEEPDLKRLKQWLYKTSREKSK
jgi:hypothetical protein